MFEVVTNLLMHKQITFEKGKLTIFNQPCSIAPTDIFFQIQKELEKNNDLNIIYYAAKQSGFKWFRTMSVAYKLTKKTDVLKWGMSLMELAGFGVSSYLKQQLEGKPIIEVKVEDSPFVKQYGQSPIGVDIVYRGLLAGAMEYTFGMQMDCIEVKCAAKGDPFCVLVVKPTENLDLSDPIANYQLSSKSNIKKTNS